MSKEKWRVPKLRFPGFTEDWEQRKFSDLYEKISEKNDLSYSLDKIISVANMYYKSDAKVSNEEYLKTYNIFRYGEIAFEGNKSKDFAYGRFVENTIGDGIISHVFEVFRPIAKYDIYFWKYYINYEPIMGKILSRCTKKTTMMTNLVAKDFLKETVLVPTLAEQKQIGTLLNAIDKFITLHQRKLNNLKLKKKALLQKLFPKNGERYPELRFPGFTDAWEQRKFGELFILKSGVAFKLSEYTKTGIPIINGESIKAGKISLEKINYLPNEYQYKYQECLLFPGDIVLGLNRPIIDGTLKISRIPADIKKSLLYQRAGKIIFKVNMDENFTYQLLSKEVLTFTKKEAVGSDQPFITTTKLNKWDLYFPVKDKERRNIGSLFNNIDNIITLHQRKLDHLQLQKKALLQQMFV